MVEILSERKINSSIKVTFCCAVFGVHLPQNEGVKPGMMLFSKQGILLDKDDVFHQYREYNNEHEVILEIGYHHEKTLGKGDVLHIHIFKKPGIDYHNDPTTGKRKLTRLEYEKYKKLFKGVNIDEGKYFE